MYVKKTREIQGLDRGLGTNAQPWPLRQKSDALENAMSRKQGAGASFESARKRQVIKEIQAAIARELAARTEIPRTIPQRIADLLRELHRRLRSPNR